jgi:hypothetical protein
MGNSVLVRAVGRELDNLRGEASRIARQYQTEWCAEPRPSGTAFCFDNEKVRAIFLAYCAKYDIPCSRESFWRPPKILYSSTCIDDAREENAPLVFKRRLLFYL